MTRDDYDRVWQYERDEEQALFDEAWDAVRDAAADRWEREHTEDVP